MHTAFDIALQTGCRLRETRIPMNCVHFKEDKITFPSPKDGEDHPGRKAPGGQPLVGGRA